MQTGPINSLLNQGRSPSHARWTQSRWLTASLGLHLAILSVFLFTRPPRLAAISMPGDRNGHRVLLTYDPGSSAASSDLKAEKRLPATPSTARAVSAPKPTPSAPATTTASTSTEAITGADGLGDGNLTIALELAHPYPHPDLTQLPSGTRGDVIVDVVIDSTGRVAKFTVTRGLGHGVDETVLATIQQWTFQPATRNGIPVASEQELLFHYERS
jgi:protein TonB